VDGGREPNRTFGEAFPDFWVSFTFSALLWRHSQCAKSGAGDELVAEFGKQVDGGREPNRTSGEGFPDFWVFFTFSFTFSADSN
jgi:hypothetical protein